MRRWTNKRIASGDNGRSQRFYMHKSPWLLNKHHIYVKHL